MNDSALHNVAPSSAMCIDQLVALQCSETPDQVAVEIGATRLTYAQLETKVQRLSLTLIHAGVKREDVVAVLIERSVEMVIALLAIHRAGAAYLPLDGMYPLDRLRYMVGRSKATAVVVTRSSADLAARLNLPCVDADEQGECGSGHFNTKALTETIRAPHDLAYVLFTSGSTGEPKGVLVPHEGVVNRLLWMRGAFSIGCSDRFLHKTPLGFDVSVWELFVPLISGARVVLADPGRHADAPYLARLMREKKISIAHFVPAMLRQFLADCPDGFAEAPYLRHVVCSGEELTPALVKEFYAHSTADLHNHYGPTEASIEVTSWRCKRDAVLDRIPIGYPIDNVTIEIFDDDDRPVRDGEIGEIYLGGVCLARGYLEQDDLTQSAFRMMKTSATECRRMYRTGDFGRRTAEGAIEFFGRSDGQVKIRGYRVELGEVERHLERLASVQAAIVCMESEGGERLTAYVTPRAGELLSIDDLRRHCEAFLPAYMWPTQIVVASTFPLTVSGKTDRKAFLDTLNARAAEREVRERIAEEPQTQTEREVAEVWSLVTGCDQVSRFDNFFWTGASSIMLVQMLSGLSWKYDIDLDLTGLSGYLTVAGLAQQIDRLLENRGTCDIPAPGEMTRSTPVPLSVTQERIWLLERLGVAGSAFTIPAALRIQGSLNVEAMRMAIQEVVRRHETLRTKFDVIDGQPYQVIMSSEPLDMELIDLTFYSETDRAKWLSERLSKEASTRIDPTRDRMFRATLARFSEQESYLFLTLHHLVADGWSLFSVLPKELFDIYQSFAVGDPSPFDDLPFQYAEFACWQRAMLRSHETANELLYWKSKLDGAPTVLEFPTDRPRPPLMSYRGESRRFSFSKDLSESIRRAAREHRCSLFMLLVAAYQIVLSRWSGQEHFLVGSTNAGRTRRDLEGMIGCFLNTMILRADLSGNPRLKELLGRVRQTVLEALAHQHIPIEKLIAELQPERDFSRQPLYQFVIALHNVPFNAPEVSGIKVSNVIAHGVASKVDLSLHVFDMPEGLTGYVEYSTELFEEQTVDRILSHMEVALTNLTHDLDKRLSETSIVPASERTNAPADSVVAPVGDECEETIVAQFDRQVAQFGESLAVSNHLTTFTYSSLNSLANGIAAAITACVGAREGRVALLFGHEVRMVAAMLAVLKAGKTYVPIDPGWPNMRIKSVLEDCNCELLLTTEDLANTATELMGEDAVLDVTRISAISEPAAVVSRGSSSVAYILYTSGTTGKPRGVYQSDRNVVQYARTYGRSLSIDAQDKLTLLPSYACDAAVMDIWGALLSGASLHLYDVRHQSLSELHRWIDQSRITIWHSTPTLLRVALSQFPEASRPSVRTVVLGGEKAMRSDIELVRERVGAHCKVVNGYGPTEATIATQYVASCDRKVQRSDVPIGYPVGGAKVFLTDAEDREAELRGEICVESPYVALGYWGDVNLTNARFRRRYDGSRYYRTGDLALRLADGSFQYLGRIDGQAKIRGHRVELEEIEAALESHASVRHAVAAVHSRSGEQTALIAAVVLVDGASTDPKDILLHLRARVPLYMLPSAVNVVDKLPLMPNGKIDRTALHDLDQAVLGQSVLEVPRSEVERRVHEIWVSTVGVKDIDIHQDFFEIGGDSLMAMWMLNGIHESFGVELTLASLFEMPTIAALSEHLSRS